MILLEKTLKNLKKIWFIGKKILYIGGSGK